MKKFTKVISIILMASTALTMGCSSAPQKAKRKHKIERTNVETTEYNANGGVNYDEVEGTTYDEEQMREAYINYCLNLFASDVNEEDNDTNVLMSPASIMSALQMAAAGANNSTLEEMIALINPEATPEEVQAFASEYMNTIESSENSTLNSANSVWINSTSLDGYLNSNYMDYLNNTFGIEAFTEPFSNDTVDEVNEWCNENTNEMIPEVLDNIDSSAIMLLVNAIAFEGVWETPFSDYQVSEEEFTQTTGNTIDVTMLNDTLSSYFETDLATGFRRYYEGGDYYFLAILPKDETITANEFAANFTGEDYEEFINSIHTGYDVYTKIPEFSYSYDTEISNVLQEVGVREAFSPEIADFSNIAQIPDRNIFINRVIHSSFIELDRNGTRAAAATVVELTDEACAECLDTRTVYLDRPFMYAIVENNTNTPVFIGTYNG